MYYKGYEIPHQATNMFLSGKQKTIGGFWESDHANVFFTCPTVRELLLLLKDLIIPQAVMLGRNLAHHGIRTARSASKTGSIRARCVSRQTSGSGGGSRRFASTSPSTSNGASNKGSYGTDSILVGAGLLGVTVLAGYASGKLGGRRSSSELLLDAGQPSGEQSINKQGNSRTTPKTMSKSTPASVVRKADEATQSMPRSSGSSSSSSSPSSSLLTSSQSSPSPPPSTASSGDSLVASADMNTISSDSDSTSSESFSKGKEEEEEQEDSSQAAFNPETGEINWDCPCLGGMAHGVCGEDFKAAFSCFVYSKEEPKGQDCIERFKAMQDCFRAHPDVYGEEGK